MDNPLITRRRVLQASLAGSTALLLPTSKAFCAAPETGRPNVLMIIADDMNDYGFYGTLPGLKMPYLAKFKQSALTFDRAYCAAPACIPSRAAVFSGLYPHHTGCYLNDSAPWRKPPFTGTEALPECFRRNGYTTFGRGKLFHSEPPPERRKAMWDNDAWGGGFGPFITPKNRLTDQWWGCEALEDDSVFPDVKNAEAMIEFLRQDHAQPFCAVYGLWRPHTPFTAPKRFFDMYNPEDIQVPVPAWRKDDLDDVPELGRKLTEPWGERYKLCGESNPRLWRQFVHGYCACTTFADWSAGRVIEALDRSKYAGNTVVVFWSDNGYHCGEKNHWEKTTLWENSARTPCAVRLPDRRNAGARCGRPVGTLDLFPTLVDLCHLQAPPHTLDGRSLRPLLENPQATWDRPAITTYGAGYFSARDERYRYIRYPDGTEELYDHQTDTGEHTNRAGDPALKPVKEQLARWIPDRWAPSVGGRLG
jgi:arylsulfatase A-like enzyme